MKMNISILADALREHFQISKRVARHRRLTLNHPMRYLPGLALENGGVYLAIAHELPADPSFPEECALICIGPAPEAYTRGDCDYVELTADTEYGSVLNCLQRVYDRLDSWYTEMQACIIAQKGLQEMMDLSLPLFLNPVYCANSQFKIIAYSEYAQLVDVPRMYDRESDRNEMVNELRLDKNYDASFLNEGTTLWQDNIFPFDTLYCNIFLSGRYWGKLMLDGRCRAFLESDYILADILAAFVKQALLSSDPKISDSFRPLERTLTSLLNGNALDPISLHEDLTLLQWENCRSFFCVLLYTEPSEAVPYLIKSCCGLVEQKLIMCRAFPYHPYAVIVVPMDAWNNNVDYFCSELSPILRDGLYKASVSGVFHDFFDFRRYFCQAQMAMEMGIRSESTSWIFHYEEYALPYMLEKCVGTLSAKLLTHPKLLELMDYDRENGLEYVKTLRCYLENNCSQAQTCRAMYLHRSTLLQRLARITQLTDFDLDDDNTRLYLRMIFRVMECHCEVTG